MALPLSLKERSVSLTSTVRPLSDRNFSIFWSGAFLSSIGFWIQTVGQGWQVLTLTHSALLLGLVTLIATLPNIVLSLLGGVFADRWNRRHVLICTQAVFMFTALSLGLFTSLHIISVWLIIFAALINGIFNSVGLPAWQTFVTDLVPRKDLKQGVALDFMQVNLSRAIGPAIGGISVGILGIAGSYYMNSLSYVAVIVPLLLIHTPQRERAAAQQSIWRGLKEGLDYLRSQQSLQLALLLQFLLIFMIFPFATLLPIFASDIFHIGAEGLGAMNALVGVGAFTGALLFLTLNQYIKRNLRLLVVICIVGGVGCIALAVAGDVRMAVPILVTLGICTVMPLAVTNTSIQVLTPEALRGRILSIRILISFGLAPIGNLVTGWIAQLVGAQLALVVDGGLCMLIALAIAVLQARRGIELVASVS